MAMPTERYEILILGSGFGGKLLAWDMAGAGHRTAVVERRWIGGSCPNINCLPSKNEIWSAKVADLVHHAADFGLLTGPYKIKHAARAGAEARNGRSGGRRAPRKLQGEQRRIDHGHGTLRRTEDRG